MTLKSLISPVFLCSLLSAFVYASAHGEQVGPFTIVTERGAVTASWTGDAGRVVEGAPTAADIAALAGHPAIQTISIKGNTLLDGKGFGALSALPNLRTLRLGSCGPSRFSTLFGEAGDYLGLASLQQVTTIGLDHLMISVSGAAQLLRGMKNLETFGVGTFADDAILEAATQAPNLKSLSFGHWRTTPDAQLTMAGFRKWAKLTQLTNAQTGALIPSDGTPSDMIDVIVQLVNLESIKFPLSGLKSSAERRASREQVSLTAADLRKFAALSKLRFFGIYGVAFEPGALAVLNEFPALAVFEVGNASIPEGELEALKADLPKLRINQMR